MPHIDMFSLLLGASGYAVVDYFIFPWLVGFSVRSSRARGA